jgi:hypothetical protein
MHAKFWSKNLKERVYMKDLGSEKLIILIWILVEIAWEGV